MSISQIKRTSLDNVSRLVSISNPPDADVLDVLTSKLLSARNAYICVVGLYPMLVNIVVLILKTAYYFVNFMRKIQSFSESFLKTFNT